MSVEKAVMHILAFPSRFQLVFRPIRTLVVGTVATTGVTNQDFGPALWNKLPLLKISWDFFLQLLGFYMFAYIRVCVCVYVCMYLYC